MTKKVVITEQLHTMSATKNIVKTQHAVGQWYWDVTPFPKDQSIAGLSPESTATDGDSQTFQLKSQWCLF